MKYLFLLVIHISCLALYFVNLSFAKDKGLKVIWLIGITLWCILILFDIDGLLK